MHRRKDMLRCVNLTIVDNDAMVMIYTQMLWLFGPNHEITEVGAMNMFFLLKSKTHHPDIAPLSLVTPSLSRGDILPGMYM
jgi:branched-chain amino acid aminotransferase